MKPAATRRAIRPDASLIRYLRAGHRRGATLARAQASPRRPEPRVPRFAKCRALFRAVVRVPWLVLQFVLIFIVWHRLLRPVMRLLRPLWRTVTLCRIFGVPVQMHTTALLYPSGVFLAVTAHGRGWHGLTLPLGMLGMFWFSLLVHEFAHILVARRCGIGTERMVFHPFGAVALLKKDPRMGREFWIAVAGPISSLVLAGVSAFVVWKMERLLHGHTWRWRREHEWLPLLWRLARPAVWLNCYIAAFNMIPVFPMDGGRVMRSLLALGLARFTRRTRDEALRTATKLLIRCIAWPIVLCLACHAISRFFIAGERVAGFLLLPNVIVGALMLLVGESEYSLLCEEGDEAEKDAVADS